MRVGLNATCFNDRPSGARQRFVQIYGALVRRCADVEFLVYEPEDCAVSSWFGDAANVRAVPMPVPSESRLGRSWQGLSLWPRRLAADRLDLFEQFNLPLIRSPRCPTVLTIHDVRSTRSDSPWPGRMLARIVHRDALRGADRIITVSDSMKQELLALEPSAKVTRIYNGVDAEAFVDAPRCFETAARLGVVPGFLLAVGHLEARKNYGRLIAAMTIMRRTRPDPSLLIVGRDGGERAALLDQVSKAGLDQHVTILNEVDDRDLVDLYHAAGLVLFASSYEGFGIPVLEAMASRRPIATSDIAVFVELSEGQGVTFPADDADAIARTVLGLLDDPARQQQLVDFGSRRVADFRPDRLAAEVEAVYRSLIALPQPTRPSA